MTTITLNGGTYILVFKANRRCSVQMGSLGKIKIEKAFTRTLVALLVQVVSGLASRDILKERTKHWHIDYVMDY